MGSSDADRALEVYLSDHLAGSAAAIQLVNRCRGRDPQTERSEFLGELVGEIEEDRTVLQDVMARVGASVSPLKQTGAKGVELLASLKHRLPGLGSGSPELAQLEEVEVLSLGIEGKRLLWRLLGALADARLEGVNFTALERRAQDQRDRLERFRLELASDSFGG